MLAPSVLGPNLQLPAHELISPVAEISICNLLHVHLQCAFKTLTFRD